MKITNNFNLPENLYNAVCADDYDSGGADYTTTTLTDPVRIVLLSKRHWNELEDDASDRIWMTLGKAVHYICERGGADNALVEERVFMEVAARKISGQVDIYHDGVIDDYKVTSAWTAVFGSRDKEWEEKMNIYAELFHNNGWPVSQLRIISIYRDWSATNAKRDANYPQKSVAVHEINLWPQEMRKDLIEVRVENLKAFEDTLDEDLPYCTAEEMWEKPTVYAVMKEGRKSAVNGGLFGTEASAQVMVDSLDSKHSIQVRPGQRTRCELYCSVNRFCNQYSEYLKNEEAQNEIDNTT